MGRGQVQLARVLAWSFLGAAIGHGEDFGATCAPAPGTIDQISMLQVHGVEAVASKVLATSGDESHAHVGSQNKHHGPKELRGPPGGGVDLDLEMLVEDHSQACHTVFLTNVFTTRADPQGKRKGMPDFTYFERYYRSMLSLPSGRASALILYDYLPEELVSNYTTGDGTVSFLKVDVSHIDKLMGLNDLRFLVFEEQVKKHPEWETIFLTDIRDVMAIHNPCFFVNRNPDKLFVGSQPNNLKPYKWALRQFAMAGGKYLDWYNSQPDDDVVELNAGLLGGKRPMILSVLRKINEMLMDPELGGRKNHTNVTVNMAAVNYACYQGFGKEKVVTGSPLHSEFRSFENRTNVYFWHK
eukprot:CAMPEP_0176038796 /NCGR_PEP_ID=MMETSP0120_2-20121206/19229_1 /TAXON_ID=160619 /ORGANISM="Kryptoperidinium foliaceum, Strain CCMP 1326" /LENGTH=354 /DNA_ID=CAMNT_0017372191 /DNA_START=65 /DNA_END=1129 /DNA_ORIENTATION=+